MVDRTLAFLSPDSEALTIPKVVDLLMENRTDECNIKLRRSDDLVITVNVRITHAELDGEELYDSEED